MHEELKTFLDGKEGNEGRNEEADAMEAFWEAAVKASHDHLQEWPLLSEDLQLYYSNEEYLAEVLLQLIATF